LGDFLGAFFGIGALLLGSGILLQRHQWEPGLYMASAGVALLLGAGVCHRLAGRDTTSAQAATSRAAGTPSTFATNVPRWQVLLVLVGLPALYMANSFTPWSAGLFYRHDHAYFLPFFASVVVLHWGSVALVLILLKRAGGWLEDIGLTLSPLRVVAMVGIPLVVGLALIVVRETSATNEGPPSEPSSHGPATLGERLFWVFMSFTAGFCEELVYRGFAIRVLQGRGMRTWLAVLLATLAFVFMHGIAAVFGFPFFFTGGLLLAALFLWRRNLVPGVCLHALLDVVVGMGYF
jgi:membrane protease YdiL (CAAX protease family)